MPRHKKPLVLLVTRNFPPLVGGMERVNLHMVRALQLDWRVALCGPTGASACLSSNCTIHETAIRPLSYFLGITLVKAVWFALRRRPALVIAGSGLAAPIAWIAARCCGGRMAVYLHGLDLIVDHPIYQSGWLPFIRRSDIVIANSRHTAALALARGVPSRRVHVLNPGTGLPSLDPRAGWAFRERFQLGRVPLLLSVGRLTRRKGLAEFVQKVLPRVVENHSDVVLLVIGGDASNALHKGRDSEKERILACARSASVECHLRFLGNCDEGTLQSAYQACDLHVFPVVNLPGDVEGFGMVALEAAAHGLATVTFAVGGIPDAVSAGQTGELVAEGDYDGFVKAVLSQLALRRDPDRVTKCRAFAQEKAWPTFGRNFRALLRASLPSAEDEPS